MNDISLGSLMALVLLRSLFHNFTEIKDVYMQTTVLAALANMSAHFRDIHTITAQKFLGLFDVVSRRYIKLHGRRAAGPPSPTTPIEAVTRSDFSVTRDILRLLLEIFNSILCSSLSVRLFWGQHSTNEAQ